MKYILRILMLPAIALICLVPYFKALYRYIRYGGETILYQPDTKNNIHDVFLYLKTLEELKTK